MGQNGQDGMWQGPSMKDSFNIFHVGCSGLGACVVPFLRTGFGTNYPGLAGFFGLIVMFLYAALGPVPEMFSYIGVWLFVVIFQRAKTFSAVKKGTVVHSRYWGDPWVGLKVPFVKKEKTARELEPVLCLLAGVALCGWSPGVGGFVIVAGFANAIAGGIVVEVDRKKLQAMRDAEIEQRYLAARYRGEIDEP